MHAPHAMFHWYTHNNTSCRLCQRQTGASFALHAMIETNRLKVLKGEPEVITVPSSSGAGQSITRCAKCHCSVWSAYLCLGREAEVLLSLDVGTLDNPDLCPPEYHIYTRFKQPWIVLSDSAPAFEAGYDRYQYWTSEQNERRNKASEVCHPGTPPRKYSHQMSLVSS